MKQEQQPIRKQLSFPPLSFPPIFLNSNFSPNNSTCVMELPPSSDYDDGDKNMSDGLNDPELDTHNRNYVRKDVRSDHSGFDQTDNLNQNEYDEFLTGNNSTCTNTTDNMNRFAYAANNSTCPNTAENSEPHYTVTPGNEDPLTQILRNINKVKRNFSTPIYVGGYPNDDYTGMHIVVFGMYNAQMDSFKRVKFDADTGYVKFRFKAGGFAAIHGIEVRLKINIKNLPPLIIKFPRS